MRINFILLLSCLMTINIFSQDFNFGEVSKEELREKFNPIDSSASASFLYKYRRTYYEFIPNKGFIQYSEIHERVKIYNQDGFEHATVNINLYRNSNLKEGVSGLKGITYNLVEGEIQETKLKKEGEFDVELSNYLHQKSFTLPNLTIGSIVEYKYRVSSPFLSVVDDFVLQEDLPIKRLNATLEAPEYFNFRMNMRGFLDINPKKEKGNGNLSMSNRNGGALRTDGGFRGGPTSQQTIKHQYATDIHNYELINVPAIKEEPFVNSIDNYRSSVNYELSYVHFPNSAPKFYTTTWEDVIRNIYESPDFGSELQKTAYYKDDLNKLLENVTGNEARISKIFEFVKSQLKWNGYNSKYTNIGGVRKAYKEKSGNVAEINLILTSMLRQAGFEANPVLVSTRNNGIPLFPTREGFNYVICAVQISKNMLLLDATSEYSHINVLPQRVLNWEGRLIKKDGTSEQVSLYPTKKSESKIFVKNVLEENGDLNGQIRDVNYAHDALNFRNKYLKTNKEDFLANKEGIYGGIEISNFTVKNEKKYSKPVIESYSFYKEGVFDKIGDRIYFSPLFFLKLELNPFKSEKREFPIDYGYPKSQEINSTITLPSGYKVEFLPEPLIVSLPDELGQMKYNILKQSDNVIQVHVYNEINQAVISPIYYETIKDFYSKMIEKMNEKVVLSKIDGNANTKGTTGG